MAGYRSSLWLARSSIPVLAMAVGLGGCGRGAGIGELCEVNSDCAPGLYCEEESSLCQMTPITVRVDAGTPGSDSGTPVAVCGDAVCNGVETCTDCVMDCGPCNGVCGDGFCSGDESCTLCPADCGPCPAECGNAACEAGESCSNCAADCGACSAECGNGILDPDEQCDDGNLVAGDGCGVVCNLEAPCVRSPLPATTPLGSPTVGNLDEGGWELDISPAFFEFQGQMRSRFSISTNGYVRPGVSNFLSVVGYENRWTDVDARYANGESMIGWLSGDGDMGQAMATYDLDPANDRLVLQFLDYRGWGTGGGGTNVQLIFHLGDGHFEILYLGGSFEPSQGRDWSIGVSEPNLAFGTSCTYSDFATWTPGGMSFPFGCIANHVSGGPPPGGTMASHYSPLAGRGLCFVKTGSGYEVSLEPLIIP